MSCTVFTSCANNYLAKALLLVGSIKQRNPSINVILVLSDIREEAPQEILSQFDDVWTAQDLGYSEQWIFSHSIMELCTAVKGRALERVLDEPDCQYAVYLDPDVYAYKDVELMVELLQNESIGLVPHLSRPAATTVELEMSEKSVLEHGTYNLGHLVVRNDTVGRAFARWWRERLDDYCYDDRRYGVFTDQRWADPVPAFFEGVKILKYPGINVASWNLAGRTIEKHDDDWLIDGLVLMTYHFSGADARGVHNRVRTALFPDSPNAVELEFSYLAELETAGQSKVSRIPFGYDRFSSGRLITQRARLLYRDAVDLQNAFPNPFATGDETYETWLIANRPDTISGYRLPMERRKGAWEQLFDADFYCAQLESTGAARPSTPSQHYRTVGSRLGFDPNFWFNTSHYRSELARSGLSTTYSDDWLSHYISVGLPEGVEPTPYFDSSWYLANNSDVLAAVESGVYAVALAHYAAAGHREDRSPSNGFLPHEMRLRNPEVAGQLRSGEYSSIAAALTARWRRRHLGIVS